MVQFGCGKTDEATILKFDTEPLLVCRLRFKGFGNINHKSTNTTKSYQIFIWERNKVGNLIFFFVRMPFCVAEVYLVGVDLDLEILGTKNTKRYLVWVRDRI